MKIRKTMLSAVLAMGCATMSAQEQQSTTEYVFNPHWYVQGQIGGQYTLGEIGFGDLLSPNVQVGVEYNFNPVVGARFAVNAWQSKAGYDMNGNKYDWKWNYVAPSVDATFNLSNLICGYNPERLVNVGVFAGIGLNIGFSNGEAADANAAIAKLHDYDKGYQPLRNLWDGTKCRFLGRAGANVDFRINDALSVGLEVQATTLSDHYNSKRAGNSDWYFNALVGVKYAFGKTYSTRTKETPVFTPVVQERVVEKIVEKKVEVVKKEPLRRDIFFTINATKISITEMQKVKEVADYLKKYPEAKVEIAGYADKGTGNAKINNNLSVRRAQVVADLLKNEYGIAADRITTTGKGDTVQPFKEDVLNRVSICIAE